MDITIDGIDFQRNGIGGEPFYQVFFRFKEPGIPEKPLIGILTGYKCHCFVVDPANIENHWRGDHFESDLRKAICNHYAKKYGRSYEEERTVLNRESDSEDNPW